MRLSGVCYSYSGGGEVLGGVTCRLSSGVTLLVGPNGGGKTTLLCLLAGLLERGAGEIVGDGGVVLGALELRRMSRMVMQDAEPQILGATVREDIELGRAASELGGDFDGVVGRLSERFGLAGLLDESVETLSYGQKKRLCLAHALLAGPRVLLLDEPFAGLDYPAALELRGFIREHAAAGLAQVVSTHELEPVFDLADWMIVMVGGRVVAEGSPGELAPELGRWSVRAPGGVFK